MSDYEQETWSYVDRSGWSHQTGIPKPYVARPASRSRTTRGGWNRWVREERQRNPSTTYQEEPSVATRVRDLPLPVYLFVLTICVFLVVLLAWAVLYSYVFVERLPKTVNAGYVGLPYVS